MKHNKKLLRYLQSIGILEHGTDEQINQTKKEFWKQEDKARLKRFRSSHQRKEVSLSQKEFDTLAIAAKRHGVQLGTFIRLAALAYVKAEFLLPSDSRIQELEIALRRIGNNINQLTRHVHQQGMTQEDLSAFQNKLNELEDRVAHALRQPIPLKDFLSQLLKKQPEYAEVLEQVLNEFRNDHQNK